MSFADLHIHSVYSDGSYTPEQIVTRAHAGNVSLLAVTDHNVIEGSLQASDIARAQGIQAIPGVEISTFYKGGDLHVLCYGADFTDSHLLDRIHHARWCLDEMSVELLRRMLPEYPTLSMEDFDAFERNPAHGGWKMLDYLCARNIIPEMNDAFELYERYHVTYGEAGFDPVEEILAVIRRAGGLAFLAHPGVSLPCERIGQFTSELKEVLELGFDGIECYYPRHSSGITRVCLEECEARNLLISSGSDCHGVFNHQEIGNPRIPVNQLRLGSLLHR